MESGEGGGAKPVPLRLRIEAGLDRFARRVIAHPWLVLVLFLGVAAGLASFIPSMEVKMSSEDFLFEDDPVRARYDAFKEAYGQDQIAMLVVEPPEIFDLDFLQRLASLHRELEDEVPFLEEVTSLVNVRSTRGRGDELIVEDLLEEMPTDAGELEALRDRVAATPFYVKSGLLSSDGRATGIRIEVAVYGDGEGEGEGESDDDGLDLTGFDEADQAVEKKAFLSGAENARLIGAVLDIVERYDAPDFPIAFAGGTMLTYAFTEQLGRDVPRFVGGGMLVMALLLVVVFRRWQAVLLAFAVVVPATLSTFGLAAALGIAFSAASQIVPSFLLAIGVSYSVHLITIFATDQASGSSREEAIAHALRHSGLAILMTGLTTSAGLLSFFVAAMKPIQEMGMLSSIGVGMMLIYSLVLLPALLAVVPIKSRPQSGEGPADRILRMLARSSATRPWPMLIATVVLVVLAGVGMTRLYMSSDPVSWFPKDHPYRLTTEMLNERFGGTYAVEIVLDTGRENGVKSPELMRRIEAVDDLVQAAKAEGALVTYTNSILDIVKETHQALNENDPAAYAIPDDPALLAQELILFENSDSDDLEKVVDSQFEETRLTVRTAYTSGSNTKRFLAEFEPELHSIMEGVADVSVTGMSAMIGRTVDAVQESMARSYALALALITPLMVLLIGSLRSGLVSMVPNLVPILLTLGLMGFMGIPLDMFTLLAGCIAIGLAVDDSIHFISGFRRYRGQGYSPVEAVDRTMMSTGRALLFTSVVLTTGFAVMMGSQMLNLWEVGVLTTFAIAAAFVLDVTVTPALLVLTHRREEAASLREEDESAAA